MGKRRKKKVMSCVHRSRETRELYVFGGCFGRDFRLPLPNVGLLNSLWLLLPK